MWSDSERSVTEQARRAQIMSAVVETINAEGFARASLDRIAARAGTSKGVILYHFGSKDELMRSIVTEIYTGAGDGIFELIQSATTHAGRLAAYIRGNLSFLAEHRTQVRALAEIFVSFRAKDGRMVYDESQVGSVVEPLKQMLLAGQQAGEFRSFDARVMARTIRAGIDAVTPQLGDDSDLDIAAYADELVETFTRATAASTSTEGTNHD